jgi:alkanesulfonate monooxygenase SsuD/methylene tetrahydromethanopterin reductase-like flavin-dependent oxidoreductase (luciferase family)
MSAVRVGIMLPSRETAMTGLHDARGLVDFAKAAEDAGFDSVREVTPALYETVNLNDDKARADEELNEYLRAYYGQPLDVMGYVQAIRGGSVAECLDWLARYVDAGARHLIVRIGSLRARPESVAEQLLPALKELGRP